MSLIFASGAIAGVSLSLLFGWAYRKWGRSKAPESEEVGKPLVKEPGANAKLFRV